MVSLGQSHLRRSMKEKSCQHWAVEGGRTQNRSLERGALCLVRQEGRKVTERGKGLLRRWGYRVQTHQVWPTQTRGWEQKGLHGRQRFLCKKGRPNCKVSWQSTAVVLQGPLSFQTKVMLSLGRPWPMTERGSGTRSPHTQHQRFSPNTRLVDWQRL